MQRREFARRSEPGRVTRRRAPVVCLCVHHVERHRSEHSEHVEQDTAPPFGTAVADRIRLIVVAGGVCGAVVVGLGSRLAMMLLRVTSGPEVHGLTSDDGFRIGQLTLQGTLNLVRLGAVTGVIGAGAYLLVRTWLIGPRWLRLTTIGAASGAVVGSMLVHDDGIDFHALTPTWLAISVFVALPALFGVAIALTVERLDRHHPVRSWRFWWPPAVLVACFPQMAFTLPFVVIGVVVVTSASRTGNWAWLRGQRVVQLVVQGAWLGIALLGLVALVDVITDIM